MPASKRNSFHSIKAGCPPKAHVRYYGFSNRQDGHEACSGHRNAQGTRVHYEVNLMETEWQDCGDPVV